VIEGRYLDKPTQSIGGGIRPWLAFVLYVICASIWILSSHALANRLANGKDAAFHWSVIAGLTFVFISGGLLLLALRKTVRSRTDLELTVSEGTRSLIDSREELLASEAKLRNLLSRLPDVTWTTTRVGQTSYISPNVKRVLGYSAAELCAVGAKGWLNLIHPDDLLIVVKAFDLLFTDGHPFDVEYRFQRKDGTYVWLHDRALSAHLEEGTWYADGLFSDISARKQLEESRSAILKTALDGFYLVDLQGKILEVNDAYCQLSGYTREELVGMRVEDLEVKEGPAGIQERIRSVITGRSDRFETQHRRKNGRTIEIEASITHQDSGQLVCFMRDITERKRSEQKLRESEERFRQVVEGSPDGIFIQVDTLFRYLNPAALQLFGFDQAEEVLGQSMFDRIDPRFHALVRDRVRLIREKRGTAPLTEEVYIRADASTFDVEVAGIPFEFEGEPGAIVFFRDITQKKQSEHKLGLLENELRQSQKMEAVGLLAGGIAHDFNNILMVISAYAELLQDKLSDRPDAFKALSTISKASERGTNLTKQLLAFGRKQVIQPVTLELNGLVKETIHMMRPILGEDIHLSVEPSPDLAMIRADSDQIIQVLLNLCSNARDAMPTGGTLAIKTENVKLDSADQAGSSVLPAGEYVKLSVTDTGHGMERDTLEHVFEPFFTTKSRGKGTGLGLATVYGIIKQSSGHISVDSELGIGTCITMFFPRSLETPVSALAHSKHESTGTETILVVEDEEMIRTALREFLTMQGYIVIDAGSGESAMEKVGAHPQRIDVLITDVIMPSMGGRELSARIADLVPGIRTLYISGYTDDAVLRHGVSQSCEAFLQKPFSFSSLNQKLRELLR
jgi:two-component system, cell cycle sensor histidine kinase and response regulator CckA